jgi:serine/threonine protein kinase
MSTIPQRLDKYELVECLGHGGTAEVWKALDTQLQRFVAIKMLRPNLRDDPTFLVRFQREAQLIASLHHPNIVQIHDFQVFQPATSAQDSTPDMHPIAYMVMDYIEGLTLANYISNTSNKGQVRPPAEIVNLFASISLAIDYAHRQGMIHRDIKPANILVDQRNTRRNPMGEPILTDFGIAKLLNASSITQTGIQLSTPAYISPEQVQGHPATERSDLYSLAVILYQVVTGVVPFQGDSPIDVMTQHSNAAPIMPSLINPNIPPALNQVIMHGLEKDPTRRFPSAAALTIAVAHALGVTVPEFLGLPQDTPVRDDLPTLASSMPISFPPTPAGQSSTGSIPAQFPMSQQGFAIASQSSPGWPTPQTGQTGGYTPVTPGLTPFTQTVSSPGAPPMAPAQPFPAQPFPAPGPKTQRNRRITTLIAVLLVVCVVMGLAIAFVPKLLAPSNSIVGQAFYTSSGQIMPGTAQGIADQMEIDLQNVPSPPAGKSYYVWLLGDQVKLSGTDDTGPPPIQPPILLTNNLAVNNGKVHYFFPGDAQHNNLLSETSRLLITEEDAHRTPRAPSTDRTTWRYFAIIPQQLIPGDPTQLNAANHIRHLFYNESHLHVLALAGGLDFWVSRNAEKVLEWSVTARDDWYGANTTTGQIALMQPLFIRILDYLDGAPNVHIDVPPNTPLAVDSTEASVALLTVDPNRQGGANLATNPPGYIDHTELHVGQVVRAPDISPDMRSQASQILIALQNAGARLSQVHKDAVALFNMSNNDPAQLQQPQAGQLLDDMVTQATYAYIGQLDPVTNQVHPGLIQAHYEIQKLAVLTITTDLPSSL